LPLLSPLTAAAYLRLLRSNPRLGRRLTAALIGPPAASGVPTSADLAAYTSIVASPEGGRALGDFVAALDMHATQAALDLVVTAPPPTLVLWGEADRWVPEAYGVRLATDLRATWVPVPDAGHLLPAERPERVAEEVSGFLAEALPARAAR
jgi:pimeloyl-ACP methyl ester carboxylesterase